MTGVAEAPAGATVATRIAAPAQAPRRRVRVMWSRLLSSVEQALGILRPVGRQPVNFRCPPGEEPVNKEAVGPAGAQDRRQACHRRRVPSAAAPSPPTNATACSAARAWP